MVSPEAKTIEHIEHSHSPRLNRPGSRRRVGFVGTGNIASVHAQSIATVSNVELVAVCDAVRSKAEALAGKFGIARTYDSLESMLAAENLDAVHVLVPPDRHFEVARAILNAGADVFLEKPMCERAADCEALARMAADRGLRVAVDHNYLFSDTYEKLRADVHSGVLGKIDVATITWNRPLKPVLHGPFNLWMLRDPRNILLEIGSHTTAFMVDLIGEPEEMRVHPSNPVEMPNGKVFYRRWQVNAYKANTAIELRLSFVPGFEEFEVHVRGSLATGRLDLANDTYVLQQHGLSGPDLDRYQMVCQQAGSLGVQAHRTFGKVLRSRYFGLGARGNLFGGPIARAMDAFYAPAGAPLDTRIDALTGAKVIRLCEEMGELANLPPATNRAAPPPIQTKATATPRILVLGATGFIGRELVRQIALSGQTVRTLVRNPGNLPSQLRVPEVQCQTGDLQNREDLLQAMDGVDCVLHLARAYAKDWSEYEKFEIGGTRQVAECALEVGIKRLIYTSSIAAYYMGKRKDPITEDTPPDPMLLRDNQYARAKNISEQMLLAMYRERGLPLVILRPGVVIGRGGSPFHIGVGSWRHDAVCRTWGDGRNKLPLVLVEDVAAALVAAIEKPGIEGKTFNLVGDPCLTAMEYLDELDRYGGMKVQRHIRPIFQIYLTTLVKALTNLILLHPPESLPSYKACESRTLRARFDCSAAKTILGWQPTTEREEVIRRGIDEPLLEIIQ
jgi:predicted dehydrogenase/nucleoside-diphosphate-sugar epimerase